MLEKIKKSFRSASSKNGSYSVGMIALVICMVIVVNLIAGQLPENVKSIDISDNNIYGVSKTSKKVLNKLDKKVTFKIYAEKDSTDTRIKSFIKKYTVLSDKISVKWIDPVLHPAALTKAGVDKNTIVISCKDTGKTKSVSFDDILVSDSYSYYTTGSSSASEFDGEGQFTSAINSVTSEQTEKMYYTTGHGEATFSDSVTKLFSKNNLTTDEVNLMMTGKIPDDCDLLFMDAPSKDISDDEKTLLLNYLKKGGKVFIILGDSEDETPNLDEVLKEYGMQEADGYIADMQRSYQGNYYYIFPEITATDDLANNLESEMVLMINAHGLITTDPARDTITTTAFMQTSDNSYAVTEDKQEEGTYTLGAVATEQITSDDSSDSSSSKDSSSDATKTSRLTVISSESMVDSQITDTYTTLENLDLFMNAVTANFDKTKNVAIKAKSMEVSNNTMQHAGIIIGIGGVAGSVFVGMKRGYTGYMHRAAIQQDLSAVTAACMMMKRSVFEEVGGLEEELKVAFNDVDLCLRIREKGHLIVYDPYVELYHYESKTRGAEDTKEKVRRFQGEIEYMRSHWIDILKNGDPYYNRNFRLDESDFQFDIHVKKRWKL
mgnify:CR=1 FL=1